MSYIGLMLKCQGLKDNGCMNYYEVVCGVVLSIMMQYNGVPDFLSEETTNISMKL